MSLLANCAEWEPLAFYELLLVCSAPPLPPAGAGPGPEPFVWSVEHACAITAFMVYSKQSDLSAK